MEKVSAGGVEFVPQSAPWSIHVRNASTCAGVSGGPWSGGGIWMSLSSPAT